MNTIIKLFAAQIFVPAFLGYQPDNENLHRFLEMKSYNLKEFEKRNIIKLIHEKIPFYEVNYKNMLIYSPVIRTENYDRLVFYKGANVNEGFDEDVLLDCIFRIRNTISEQLPEFKSSFDATVIEFLVKYDNSIKNALKIHTQKPEFLKTTNRASFKVNIPSNINLHLKKYFFEKTVQEYLFCLCFPNVVGARGLGASDLNVKSSVERLEHYDDLNFIFELIYSNSIIVDGKDLKYKVEYSIFNNFLDSRSVMINSIIGRSYYKIENMVDEINPNISHFFASKPNLIIQKNEKTVSYYSHSESLDLEHDGLGQLKYFTNRNGSVNSNYLWPISFDSLNNNKIIVYSNYANVKKIKSNDRFIFLQCVRPAAIIKLSNDKMFPYLDKGRLYNLEYDKKLKSWSCLIYSLSGSLISSAYFKFDDNIFISKKEDINSEYKKIYSKYVNYKQKKDNDLFENYTIVGLNEKTISNSTTSMLLYLTDLYESENDSKRLEILRTEIKEKCKKIDDDDIVIIIKNLMFWGREKSLLLILHNDLNLLNNEKLLKIQMYLCLEYKYFKDFSYNGYLDKILKNLTQTSKKYFDVVEKN